jgi:magnesium chelatase family protein
MLSRAFPSILSPLNSDEVLEVSKIYSAYSPDDKIPLIHYRPFRSPHHTTSRNGLIGGGNPPKPGDITLAHNGVLFLDEFPEYPRNVLEALRQPLEDGVISISRAAGNVTFPAKFLMLAASNPCPCGFFGHPTKQCKCMPGAIASYQKRLSGPLLDRIDLHIEVMPVSDEQLTSEIVGESSESIRKRVLIARDRQLQRFSSSKIRFNRDMKSGDIKKYCNISKEGQQMLKQAISRLSLSARSYFKVLKVAQTIADLEGVDEINALHIAESLQYRKKDN